jgi:hypothetical protein
LKAGFPLLSAAFGSQNYLPTTDYTHVGSFLSFLSIPVHISLPSWSSTRRGLPTGVLRTTSPVGGSSPPWPHRHVGAAPPRPGRHAGTALRQPDWRAGEALAVAAMAPTPSTGAASADAGMALVACGPSLGGGRSVVGAALDYSPG